MDAFRFTRRAALLVLLSMPAAVRGDGNDSSSDPGYPFPVPLGLPAPPVPKDNPVTKPKVELGRLLFFDKRLSRDKTISCASCHNPHLGWTDRRPTALGFREQIGPRNAPTLLNAAYQERFFWDGRAGSLEEQAKVPIALPKEMAMTHEEVVARLAAIPGYARYFRAAFGDSAVTIDRVAMALASFERTLLSGGSPYDRYMAGDEAALSPAAARGLKLFLGKANCAFCHAGPNFTDGRFYNVGMGMQRRERDLGRYGVTKKEEDRGAFRTPTLRNLSDTAPYMHDGSQATLEDVIELYDRGGQSNPWLSPLIKPLGLSKDEKGDLLAFLRALDGGKPDVREPDSFPR